MSVYWQTEQFMLNQIAREVLEELGEEEEACFDMFDSFEIDEDMNVTVSSPGADAALEEQPPSPPLPVQEEDDNEDIGPPPSQEELQGEEARHRLYVQERKNKNTVRKTESVSVQV